MDCICAQNMFSDDSSTLSENPFGPAVGEIINVYTCSHKGEMGVLYLATKAICFRRTILFGWEVEKLIVPWILVETVRGFEDGKIIINTGNDGNRIDLDNFSEDYQIVLGKLSKIRSTCSRKKTPIMDASEGDQYIRRLLLNGSTREVSAKLRKENIDNGEKSLPLVPDEISRKNSNSVTWKELCEEKREIYTETVIMDLKLAGCTLDEFYKRFVSSDASFSLKKHHQNSGDLDVIETEWENTNGSEQKREIKYSHPINIAMAIAPPAGAATKTQKLRRYGNTGIRIDTETRISNVPMASCFYVADRMLISSLPGGGISLTIIFGNIFLKSTMFKGIIAATSVRDVTDFHKTYVEAIKSALALPNSNVSQSTVESQLVTKTNEGVIEPKRSLEKSVVLLWIFVLCSLAVHFYLMQQVRILSTKILLLEELLLEGRDFPSAISMEL